MFGREKSPREQKAAKPSKSASKNATHAPEQHASGAPQKQSQPSQEVPPGTFNWMHTPQPIMLGGWSNVMLQGTPQSSSGSLGSGIDGNEDVISVPRSHMHVIGSTSNQSIPNMQLLPPASSGWRMPQFSLTQGFLLGRQPSESPTSGSSNTGGGFSSGTANKPNTFGPRNESNDSMYGRLSVNRDGRIFHPSETLTSAQTQYSTPPGYVLQRLPTGEVVCVPTSTGTPLYSTNPPNFPRDQTGAGYFPNVVVRDNVYRNVLYCPTDGQTPSNTDNMINSETPNQEDVIMLQRDRPSVSAATHQTFGSSSGVPRNPSFNIQMKSTSAHINDRERSSYGASVADFNMQSKSQFPPNVMTPAQWAEFTYRESEKARLIPIPSTMSYNDMLWSTGNEGVQFDDDEIDGGLLSSLLVDGPSADLDDIIANKGNSDISLLSLTSVVSTDFNDESTDGGRKHRRSTEDEEQQEGIKVMRYGSLNRIIASTVAVSSADPGTFTISSQQENIQRSHEERENTRREITSRFLRSMQRFDMKGIASFVRDVCNENCELRHPEISEPISGRADIMTLLSLLLEVYPDGTWTQIRMESVPTSRSVGDGIAVMSLVYRFAGTRVFNQPLEFMFRQIRSHIRRHHSRYDELEAQQIVDEVAEHCLHPTAAAIGVSESLQVRSVSLAGPENTSDAVEEPLVANINIPRSSHTLRELKAIEVAILQGGKVQSMRHMDFTFDEYNTVVGITIDFD